MINQLIKIFSNDATHAIEICDALDNSCNGIACSDCPFNSKENLQKAIDEIKELK